LREGFIVQPDGPIAELTTFVLQMFEVSTCE